jgi:nicotinate-nucleotide pyrophosphorylase (carboxylating)
MTRAYLPELPGLMVEEQVRAALLEDLGRAGDITSNATIGPEKQAAAEMNSREAGVISGLPLAARLRSGWSTRRSVSRHWSMTARGWIRAR